MRHGGNMETLRNILDVLIIVMPITVLLIYIVLSLRDLIVHFRNYNYRRATFCNSNYCGLYKHDDEMPGVKDCLNPYVSKKRFEKISKGGNHKGCYLSIQIHENSKKRKSAEDYKADYINTVSAFSVDNLWWRILLILLAIAMLLSTDPKVKNFIETLLNTN